MITFILALILVGVALYLINTLIPMDQKIKTLVNVLIVVVAFLYVLNFFGIIPNNIFHK